MDCFIATVCSNEQDLAGRGPAIRECLPEFVKEHGLDVTVFDFGSHRKQAEWLDRCGARVLRSSPYDDLTWKLAGSERRRFLFANRLTKSEIYIVADDDCLPVTPDWVALGTEILARHSEFGMLCLDDASINRRIRPQMYSDEEVIETLSCGGVRFIRKGIVKHYRGYERDSGYDRLHARCMQSEGYKVGFFRNLLRRHLGGKCSVYREFRVGGMAGIENDREDGSIAHE